MALVRRSIRAGISALFVSTIGACSSVGDFSEPPSSDLPEGSTPDPLLRWGRDRRHHFHDSGTDAPGTDAGTTVDAGPQDTGSPPTGGTCPKGTAYPDGCTSAPTGTPPFASLLDAYGSRPPWNVAGVDYNVGVRAGTVLKSPSTISGIAGVSVNASSHVVTINGSNVTLSDYDFSPNGGWAVSIDSGSNIAIRNSKFVAGSNNNLAVYVSPSASDVTIEGNSINGAASSVQMLIGADGKGTTTIRYNLVEHSFGQNIVMSSDVGGEKWIVDYNVVTNAGEGFNQGAHGDWIQLYNDIGKNTASLTMGFNLWLQSIPIAQGRTQGLSLFSANSGSGSGGVQTEAIENNTFIGSSGAYVNFAIILDTTRLIGTGTVKDNYFDLAGIGSSNGGGGNWSFIGDYNGGNGGPYHGTVTVSGNKNMVNGNTLN